MNIHICLVSAQLLPNYISARMDQPDKVYLISTDKMRHTLTPRLQAMLNAAGIDTVLPAQNIPDAGLSAIQGYAQALLTTIQQDYPTAQLTFNTTGGNKLMSIGMLEVFRTHAGLIYTDTDHGFIEHLDNGEREPIRFHLNVPEYLSAYGALYQSATSDNAQWCSRAYEHQNSTQQLADVAQDHRSANLITSLNALAIQALSKDGLAVERPTQRFHWQPTGYWNKCLKDWSRAGLFDWQGEQDIAFTDLGNTRYMAGMWLEEFAWLAAQQAGANDARCGVEIRWESSTNTLNELDVLVTHNNKMLVIECKTLRMQNNPNLKPSDILYKIDSIGDSIKGLFGRAVLLSALEPTAGMRERAKTQYIDILRPSELASYLNRWMKN